MNDSDRWDVVIVDRKTKENFGCINDAWKDCYTWEALALIDGFNRRARKEGRNLRARLVRTGVATPFTVQK